MGKLRVRTAAAAACGMALTFLAAGAAVTQPGDPPGNNGTVKVDGVEFDSHPDNQPHVGCVFQIDFYGYDAGEDLMAMYTFEAVPPTPGGELLSGEVFIGGDAAGGGVDLDGSVTVDLGAALSGIEPHPVQGHHVRLTVHADGSQGADTKHKVFWVEACGTPPTTTPTTGPPTTSPPTTGPPTTGPPATSPPGAPPTPTSTPSTGPTTQPQGSAAQPGAPAPAPAPAATPIGGQPQVTG